MEEIKNLIEKICKVYKKVYRTNLEGNKGEIAFNAAMVASCYITYMKNDPELKGFCKEFDHDLEWIKNELKREYNNILSCIK